MEQPVESDQYFSYTDGGVLVAFQTTNLDNSVELKVKSSVPTEIPGHTSGIGLLINGKDLATRWLKAMSHAIALCGGKKSTF